MIWLMTFQMMKMTWRIYKMMGRIGQASCLAGFEKSNYCVQQCRGNDLVKSTKSA